MSEELELRVNGVYKTHVGDLVKILSIDEKNDRLHLFNISDSAKQWVNLTLAKKYKLKSRVN